jgi:PEP-CTERM motif-containing protein
MLRKNLIGAAVAFGVLGLGSASATVFTLDPTQNNSGNTVSASADITASGDLLTILLTNLSPSLSAPNQALSDLLINFSTDVSGPSGFTQSGTLITVNADGSTTAAGGSPDSWAASIVSGNLYLTALTGGQPTDMIAPDNIGSPNAGVLNFNPYIDTTGTFTLTLSGVSGLTIDGVQFSFGTQPGEFEGCVGDCGEGPGGGVIPEPGTWALMILGFGGAGVMLRRRRARLAFAG